MKAKLFIGSFAVVGLLLFNIFIGNNKGDEGSLTLQNVGLMQANAAEMWCDQSNQNECTITSSGGTTGKSTGKLIYQN